ncbi:U-box domain-containing protein 52-like [Lolium rigidum]|uniref:U-box domain-containing protein 52-like n=1 Tax=Lolium rigidum TaxID=89674 RepID=UPI001F5CB4B2|nr:U-box domain-containing protein 52-like [Lolium rigidum]
MEDVLERIFHGSIEPRDVKLSALESITENFSEERIIGAGGFGTVYKGVLKNGEVAVKRLRNNQTIDEKLFRREVNSLLNVNHKNIVKFLGFCSNTEHKAIKCEGSKEYIYAEDRERILCFEYINNGSLDKYIADELRGLQWDTRYFIIKGICEGLQYLHMKKRILHMDLKPANILIDHNMVAKITDFGLSKIMDNSQTKSTTRFLSLGYTAPEYLENGKMSVKSDVYSLGIIIIELVTGFRSVPDINNKVLRRWRHRCHKSGKETPFRYQQITKLIEIGLLCQEKDPYKRPLISDIVRGINELESTDRQVSNANESTVGHRSPYFDDDMLGIEPLELCFPFELNNHNSCLLELTNETNDFIAFAIQTTSPLPYCIEPKKDIVAPRSKYSVNITLQSLEKVPQDWQYIGDFIVRSTKVNDSLMTENITEDIFHNEEGKLVDEVNLTVTYKAEAPKVDVSLGSLIISDTRSLHSPHESSVPPTEAESEIISVSTSDEVILFDPPEVCFPMVPDKTVLSSIKIINTTESYVSFSIHCTKEKPAEGYFFNKTISILPPLSSEYLTVRRYEMEDAGEKMQFNVEFDVWYAIVADDVKACDLDFHDYTECKKMHTVGKKAFVMPRTGCLALIRLVLAAIPLHQLMVLGLDKKTLKQLLKVELNVFAASTSTEVSNEESALF